MTGPATSPPAARGAKTSTRNAVIGASFGFFVDMFDVYLPVVALTPAMNYFLPPAVSPGSRAVITSLIFVATLIGRPLGSLIFGRLADKVGRRRVTLWSITGCGICTLLIALLPGYHAVGLLGVVLMVVLRLIDGVFLGGEYTGATPLAMEAAPTGKRGWYGGLVGMGFPISYCAISLVTFIMLRIAPSGGTNSAYSQWGWRVPFLVGALLCVVFCVYFSRTVEESETWKSAKKSRTPIRDVLVGSSRKQFLQVFVIMSGIWFASNLASGLLPSALQYQAHVSATQVTAALVIVQAIHSVLFPFLGLLSEKIGRRKFLAWSGIGIGVVCAGAFATISLGWYSGFGAVLLLTLVIRLSGGSTFAVTPSYLCERFPPAVRGSGFGLGYSMPLILTSFYAYYQGWLEHIMPSGFTAAALLVLGGALVLVGSLIGPETKDVDLGVAAAGQPQPKAVTA
ncbi:MFS transporter [Amycolatopsis sp. NPDC051372]|uniref:MFS transporter n=1 Tax=Amycolatopsis sp. NPDC051372 TaxID=3155669 RepID=UPI0034154CC6